MSAETQCEGAATSNLFTPYNVTPEQPKNSGPQHFEDPTCDPDYGYDRNDDHSITFKQGTPYPHPLPSYRTAPQQFQSEGSNIVNPTSDPDYGYDRNDDNPIVLQPVGMSTNHANVSHNTDQEPVCEVPDYFVLSIISIFFCLFFGITSTWCSSKVKLMRGSQ
ncbi:hypothetical protein ElyMa_003974100 [Elysia marginata]|uniref:Uncharacterized protein n=1 Tax=Elysia marginata TaxID=1093978 RepID=A0AAV4FX18_9GAST|nr:hypothetical protein ElyMa_003974100 [Elysia marginata]